MQASVVRFDRFELDLNSLELRESDRPIKLEQLPTQLLILLIERPGELVTRDEIVQRLWGENVFVDTRQGINTAVRKLRVALADEPDHPRIVQTVATRGYRLLPPVSSPLANAAIGANDLGPSAVAITLAQQSRATQPVATTRFTRSSLWIVFIAIIAVYSASHWQFRNKETSHRFSAEKRLTSNSSEAPIKWAIVSRDGRYLAYTDPGGMYLRVLATGETRLWKLPPDFIANPNSWFPDGTHLLAMRLEGPMKTPSLWNLSMLGGGAQKILDNAGPGWVSPDGSRIAFLRTPRFGHELWVMGADGFDPHRIAVASEPEGGGFRINQIFPATWSPDGRRIAYVERSLTPSPAPLEDAVFSLKTCDANGGDPKLILKDARVRPALSWPEANRLLFAYGEDIASEHSDEGVRSIRFDPRSGKAAGPIEAVTDGGGRIGGMSSTADGKQLVLWRMNTQFQAYVAGFDAKTRRLNAPRRVTLDANGNVAEAWLPDSRNILFVSNRNGTWSLYKQGIDDATAELLTEGRSISLPRLNADGSQILYEARVDPKHLSTISLMQLPLAGGPPKLVLQGDDIVNYQCSQMPSTLCLLSKQQGADHVFFSFDLQHGIIREVLRIIGSADNWTLSPDGRTLAVFPGDHRIRFFSFENGVAHESKTVTVNDWKIEQGDWSADGKVILMESHTVNRRSVILQVDQAGRVSVLLEGDRNVEFSWIAPSPDGRYGIIETEVPGDNNAWILQSF